MAKSVMKKTSFPFWSVKVSGALSFSSLQMSRFLSHYGWGWYQSVGNRYAKRDLFQNDNGELKLHSDRTVKKWLLDLLESVDDKEFISGCFKTPSLPDKLDILDALISITDTFWNRVLNTLDTYATEQYPDTTRLKLFVDGDSVSHVRFRNGVVKITSNEITLIDKSAVGGEGVIWESELLPHEIDLKGGSSQKGLFEKFIELAFHYEIYGSRKPVFEDNFILKEDQYRAWRESYGYLLHGAKRLDRLKCPIYIDSEGTCENPEGGNGKSLALQGIQYYKSMVPIDGKLWSNDSRFEFSSVTPETKFILINDVIPAFEFSRIFNLVSDDMTIEGKGKNKKEIPAEKSPKIAISTNEVIAGTGSSYKRRQHIVEFGNYWNRVEKRGESVADKKHIGKSLYKDFNESDWNEFYDFGFRCIQEYLKNGLTESENQNYELKSLIRAVEGRTDDGSITRWMEEWVKETRIQDGHHKLNGISEEKLFEKFIKDNPEYAPHMSGSWDRPRFSKAFWVFISLKDGYYYNDHISQKGNSKSDRRWQMKDSSGNQVPHIVITSDNDP